MKTLFKNFNSSVNDGFTALGKALEMIGFGRFYKTMQDANERSLKEQEKKKRELLRHFKIQVSNGFWGTRVKYIQRESPLTDQQLSELEITVKSPFF